MNETPIESVERQISETKYYIEQEQRVLNGYTVRLEAFECLLKDLRAKEEAEKKIQIKDAEF